VRAAAQTFERTAPCYPYERVKREDVVVRSGSALACTPASLLTQTASCVRAAQPGQMVRPQFASRESSLDSLLHNMRGKECAHTLSRRVLCGLHHQLV
jgi:hypothetical protein